MNRRGSVLPDMLLGAVLLALVGAVMARGILSQHRATRAVLARAEARQAVEQGGFWLGAELVQAGGGAGGWDLLSIAPDSVSFQAYRSAGLACAVGAAGVMVEPARFSSYRLPQAGRDSLLVLGRDSLGGPEWLAAPVLGTGTGSCGGAPALALITVLDTASLSPAGPPSLTPVRTFEVMQARLYQSGGAWWLGVRSESGGEAIQPLAGPFATAGVRFSYRDGAGLPASAPAAVRELGVTLRTAVPHADSGLQRILPWNLP